ncbi:hypothetical protein ACIRO1_36540 [Streptomyces sp. NPDC102381]|uniref:hypothetical protein n=1 Tax=Streptomyces sp. NPDC102381 TaxID=3366164 RepID=UPI00382421FC
MKDFGAFVGIIVAGFILGVVGLSVSAWLVMILVGMWHGYNDAIPALSYVDCAYGVGLTILLGLIVSPAARSNA